MTTPESSTELKSALLSPARPYFSICIPQYNRTDFLIKACQTFAEQSFKDFEVCISDDCSNDGKEGDLEAYLQSSGMRYVYRRNDRTLRYDGNLRNAIALSSGHYLLLMGNDDGLRGREALAELRAELMAAGEPAVAIANYHEIASSNVVRRSLATTILGTGPELASRVFRNYSFVSGVLFRGDDARADTLTSLDGSEMYQMYLGTKLVASGGEFLSIDRVSIDKDLQVPGQMVDSYARRERLDPCPIVKRPLPMGRLLEVVATGVRPYVSKSQYNRLLFRTALALYAFTYAYWGTEYRKVQSRRYALGVLLAVNPNEITRVVGLSRPRVLMLWPVYLVSCMASLLTPLRLFDWLHPALYGLAKRLK